jgi:hypothetical protein
VRPARWSELRDAATALIERGALHAEPRRGVEGYIVETPGADFYADGMDANGSQLLLTLLRNLDLLVDVSVAAVRNWRNEPTGESGARLYMQCVGCDDLHAVSIEGPGEPIWTWNGSLDKPTVNPSLLVTGVQWARDAAFFNAKHAAVAKGEPTRCHSFIRDGVWEFLSDSTHTLAGQHVPMVALPEWFIDEPIEYWDFDRDMPPAPATNEGSAMQALDSEGERDG